MFAVLYSLFRVINLKFDSNNLRNHLFQPPGYVPFNVRQRFNSQQGASGTSISIKYVEVNVFRIQIRLLSAFSLTIDGVGHSVPYTSNSTGINVNTIAGKISLSSQFGLQVTWDGAEDVKYSHCDAYQKLVCGICGNADGSLR